MTGAWRCLFWVQSLLGSGHLRRAQLLADTFAAHGARVTLANGGPPGPWPAASGVTPLQLPPVVARDMEFSGLVDASGAAVSAQLRLGRESVAGTKLAGRDLGAEIVR